MNQPNIFSIVDETGRLQYVVTCWDDDAGPLPKAGWVSVAGEPPPGADTYDFNTGVWGTS